MEEYMEYSKTLYDEDLTFNTTMWGTDWAALKMAMARSQKHVSHLQDAHGTPIGA